MIRLTQAAVKAVNTEYTSFSMKRSKDVDFSNQLAMIPHKQTFDHMPFLRVVDEADDNDMSDQECEVYPLSINYNRGKIR